MKKKDICLDTNVIIAYLLLTEPQHLLIENFLKRNPVENYYYTEHIKKETDKIFFEKYNLIYSIFNNFRKYLKSHHNEINSLNNFIYNFIQENNRKYVYKGKILSKKELKEILANYWYNQENNTVIEGFELFKNLSDILYEFSHESLNFKKSFLENLIFIKSHTKAYPNINKMLFEYDSHNEDNLIILDLYEYYLEYNILFHIITFDNNFLIALQKCNFEFIEKITNLKP